jgi:hypothetical protein
MSWVAVMLCLALNIMHLSQLTTHMHLAALNQLGEMGCRGQTCQDPLLQIASGRAKMSYKGAAKAKETTGRCLVAFTRKILDSFT